MSNSRVLKTKFCPIESHSKSCSGIDKNSNSDESFNMEEDDTGLEMEINLILVKVKLMNFKRLHPEDTGASEEPKAKRVHPAQPSPPLANSLTSFPPPQLTKDSSELKLELFIRNGGQDINDCLVIYTDFESSVNLFKEVNFGSRVSIGLNEFESSGHATSSSAREQVSKLAHDFLSHKCFTTPGVKGNGSMKLDLNVLSTLDKCLIKKGLKSVYAFKDEKKDGRPGFICRLKIDGEHFLGEWNSEKIRAKCSAAEVC